jgi:serine/threonine protein kinase
VSNQPPSFDGPPLLSDIHTGAPSAPAGDPTQLGIGSVLADRYRILGALGIGGMGAVYLAEHVTLGKRVAIKVLKPDLGHDTTLVERFFREARATAAIQHENIVDILDFGQTAHHAYFAMEALEGCELADLIGTGRPMAWERAKPIIVQIARALAAAHRMGIVHRDMKPGNVFLIRKGGRGGPSGAFDFIKVLDFGIAKIDDGVNLTRAGMVFGTAAYMAPEQASGGEVDGRADIYALACIVFEMLTGRVPFPGDNFMKVLGQHIIETPPRLRDVSAPGHPGLGDGPLSPAIVDGLEAVIAKMLAKLPDERFASMAEVEQAFLGLEGAVPGWLLQDVALPEQLRGSSGLPGVHQAAQPTMILPTPGSVLPSTTSPSSAAATPQVPVGAAVPDADARALAPIAHLFVAFAHGTDGVLSTVEMRTLADRLRRWAPQVGLDGVGTVLREAVAHYRQGGHDQASLDRLRSALAAQFPPASLMQLVADLREIAMADNDISDAEQRFLSDTARAFGLAGDHRLEALAFMYLALGSATTGTIAAIEMKVLGEQLRQWTPGASVNDTAAALRRAVDEYKRLPSVEARLDRARAAAETLRRSTDAETLRRVLADLWRIAGADGHISPQEQRFIMDMVQRFHA